MKLYEVTLVKDGEFLDRIVWEVDGRGERANRLPQHLIDYAMEMGQANEADEVRIYATKLGRLCKGHKTLQMNELVYESAVV